MVDAIHYEKLTFTRSKFSICCDANLNAVLFHRSPVVALKCWEGLANSEEYIILLPEAESIYPYPYNPQI